MTDNHGNGGHASSRHVEPATRREPLIFVAILAAALLVPVALLTVFRVSLPLALLSLGLFIVIAMLLPRLYEFKEYERGVVFRLGRFHKVVGPGWVLLFPSFESFEKVDLRVQILDIEPQEVLTKEDLKITIDAVAYIRIVDPKKAVIEIKDLKGAIAKLIHAELRQQAGKLPLQDILERMEELNDHVFRELKRFEDEWGIKAVNVELEDIKLPSGLEEAFRKKQESIEFRDRVQIEATARREVLKIVNEAAAGLDDRTITYLYLDTLKRIADGKATKIVFPLELMHLANRLSADVGGKGANDSKLAQELIRAYLERKPQKT